MYNQILADLSLSYDRMVAERGKKKVSPWKRQERDRFLSLLHAEGKHKLLEVGAGTGVHGQFFHDRGLDVVCTDLSPAMVERCRQRGLAAHAMDFLHLDFPAAFDAVFAMNCLLHVPRSNLPEALRAIRKVLKPGGLFYLGQYAGADEQGVWPEDHYEPKRFFSRLKDDTLKPLLADSFELEQFSRVLLEDGGDYHFHSAILRNADS